MKYILFFLSIIFLPSCSKEERRCVCTNYAKAGKIEGEYSVQNKSECDFHQLQYDSVFPGEVICEIKD